MGSVEGWKEGYHGRGPGLGLFGGVEEEVLLFLVKEGGGLVHGLVEHVAGGAKVDRYVDWTMGGQRRLDDECEVGKRGCAGQAADAIAE